MAISTLVFRRYHRPDLDFLSEKKVLSNRIFLLAWLDFRNILLPSTFPRDLRTLVDSMIGGSSAKLRAGDREEWESVYLTLKRPICARIRNIVGNGAVAEELAQDVFFRLWLCRARLDEQRGSLRDLSFTMARNCALDYIRSSHHYRTAQSVTFELAESLRLIAQTGTELTYMRRGRLRSVLGKATALPKQQQKALMLAYGYGYSHTEIAVIMKTPLGTVKSWLRNALRSLREE